MTSRRQAETLQEIEHVTERGQALESGGRGEIADLVELELHAAVQRMRRTLQEPVERGIPGVGAVAVQLVPPRTQERQQLVLMERPLESAYREAQVVVGGEPTEFVVPAGLVPGVEGHLPGRPVIVQVAGNAPGRTGHRVPAMRVRPEAQQPTFARQAFVAAAIVVPVSAPGENLETSTYLVPACILTTTGAEAA